MRKARLHQENNKNRGAVTILIALLLSAMLLVIGLGVSTLIFQQLKMSGQTGRSAVAFYAADAGAETCLYQVYTNQDFGCGVGDTIEGTLDENIYYTADYDGLDTVISIGRYFDTSRALEVRWE